MPLRLTADTGLDSLTLDNAGASVTVANTEITCLRETIERNAASLTVIVEDVLDVSRIISGKLRLNVQQVDVPALVASRTGQRAEGSLVARKLRYRPHFRCVLP